MRRASLLRTIQIPSLTAALALSGCGAQFTTQVHGPLAAPSFHFAGGAEPPCASDVSIFDRTDSMQMWELHSYVGHCVAIGELDYGKPPTGLTETYVPRPFSANARYSIAIVENAEHGGPYCEFAWRGGRWTTLSPDCGEQ